MILLSMLFALVLVVANGLIWWFALDTDRMDYEETLFQYDKLLHLIASFALACGGWLIFRVPELLSAVISLVAGGVLFEAAQKLPSPKRRVPWRSLSVYVKYSWRDILADAVGAALAFTVIRVQLRLWF